MEQPNRVIVAAAICALYLKKRLYGRLSFWDVLIPALSFIPAQYETLFVTANFAHGPFPFLLILLYCLAGTCRNRGARYSVILIVNFVTAWGEYLLCVTLIDDEKARTMPVVLAAAQSGQGQWSWPNIAAVYMIVVAPGIVAFSFAQKLFFKGLMEGALKA